MTGKRKLTTKQKIGALVAIIVGTAVGSFLGYLLTHKLQIMPSAVATVMAVVFVLNGRKQPEEVNGK